MGDSGVKFIRRNGKIIPIRSGSGSSTGKKKSEILKVQAKSEEGLAKKGRIVASTLGAGATVAAIAAAGSKKFRPVGFALAGLGAAGALLNASFASGRAMAAKDYRENAERVKSGKKVVQRGIGGASDRAYNTAKIVGSLKGKVLNQVHKAVVGKKNRTSA